MSDKIESKKPGRPSEGIDAERVTVRLSNVQRDFVRQYSEKHDVNDSAVIRIAIDTLSGAVMLSEMAETSCANLLDIAKVFDRINGENSHTYAQVIREAALVLYELGCKESAEHFSFDVTGKNDQGETVVHHIP